MYVVRLDWVVTEFNKIKTMITKVTFMAFDKQCEMLFTDKSEVEIKADLYLLCSTYVLLSMIPEEDIQAEDLPF